MKKILVTGGAGYIGSHTVKELVEKGFQVIVLDDLRSGFEKLLPEGVVLEKIGLENKSAVKEVFLKHKPDAVIDFAAYLAVGESMVEPEKYFENNVENFIHLLDVMHETGCNYIVKSSTAAVYGNPTKDSDIPWKETFTNEYKPAEAALLEGKWGNEELSGEKFLQKFLDLYRALCAGRPELVLSGGDISKLRIPLSIYGVSKLLDEIILEKYNKAFGINYVALRYFNVCGADPEHKTGDCKPKATNLMTLIFAQINGKLPQLAVFGDDYPTKDGTGVRDYIHPSDLANGHVLSLKYLFSGGRSEVFNHATGEASTVMEVIQASEKVAGKKVNYKIESRRSGDPSVSVADSSKAKEMLGWEAKYRLSEMAETAWEWESEYKEKILK
ncbi:MAG: UDP-glucose 4-epimerase [Candidatus Berkelbacteria bacterium]|nr:UDP-glucose 4-epimerase [Candidatus Berkelbacteria bacterium]